MPTLLTDAPERKRWTREECAALESSGIFDYEHIELIDGELISRMAQTRAHVNAFTLMIHWLVEAFDWQFLNVAAPVDVAPGDNLLNEPIPDLIVLNRESSAIVSGNPQPGDLSLAFEISDTTLAFDLTVKASLYARANIVEYWVLDVPGRRLIVHRNPASGKYTSVIVYSKNEPVAPLAASAAEFRPAKAFGQ